MNPFGYIAIAGGAFTITAAALDWDFFMNHSKARLWVSLFGRNGARVFYLVLGLALAALGVVILLSPEN